MINISKKIVQIYNTPEKDLKQTTFFSCLCFQSMQHDLPVEILG